MPPGPLSPGRLGSVGGVGMYPPIHAEQSMLLMIMPYDAAYVNYSRVHYLFLKYEVIKYV